MGYYVLMAVCAACGRSFTCNPHRVPSLRIRGEREAICRSCAERWIQLHPGAGVRILPGAYDPEPEGGAEPWAWEEE